MTTVGTRSLTSHLPEGGTRRRYAADGGFSLVEAIVASFIVVVLFAGFGRSLGTAYLGSKDNAAAQEATAIGVEQLEFARSLDWFHIAMSAVDAEAPLIDDTLGVLLASETGLDADEPLVVDPEDGLIEPTGSETVDGVNYSVWRFVSDAPDGLRRVVVLIEWQAQGAVSRHRTSTLIAEAATR